MVVCHKGKYSKFCCSRDIMYFFRLIKHQEEFWPNLEAWILLHHQQYLPSRRRKYQQSFLESLCPFFPHDSLLLQLTGPQRTISAVCLIHHHAPLTRSLHLCHVLLNQKQQISIRQGISQQSQMTLEVHRTAGCYREQICCLTVWQQRMKWKSMLLKGVPMSAVMDVLSVCTG